MIKKSDPLFGELDRMTFLSKNLYNQALYRVRQYFFETNGYLRYGELSHTLSSEKQSDFTALPAKVSQWVLKQLDKNFISFFKSLKSDKVKHKVNIPKYLNKNGRNLLTFTNQAVSSKELKNGYLKLSGCDNRIKICHTNVQQVRVVPKGNVFVVEVIYDRQEKEPTINDNYAGIDLGINNLATVGGNKTRPFIINGRPLKSINQYYNKNRS